MRDFAKFLRGFWFIPFFFLFQYAMSLVLPQTPFLRTTLGKSLISTEVFVFLPPTLVYLAADRPNWREALSIRPLSWKNALLVLGMTLLLTPMGMFISAVSSILYPNPATSAMTRLDHSFWKRVVVLALLPAICEELPFRGVMLHQMRKFKALPVCVITALAFAIMHMNLQQFPYAFFLGFFFCMFTKLTGSILASMLAHFAFNLVSVGLSMLPPEILVAPSNNFVNVEMTIVFLLAFTCWILFVKVFMDFIAFNKGTHAKAK
jgi:membrane protease YdiL (CAAX protease family)